MNIRIIAIALLLIALPVSAQKKKTVVNDSNRSEEHTSDSSHP